MLSGEARELLPRAAADRTPALCRGKRSGGEMARAVRWQDRCWRGRPCACTSTDACELKVHSDCG